MHAKETRLCCPTGTAGPFVFTAAITPHRAETGSIVRMMEDLASPLPAMGVPFVDIALASHLAQTAQCMTNLAQTLKTAGTSLDRLVHLRVLVTDPLSEGPVLGLILTLLPAVRPAVSIVVVDGTELDPRILVQIDAVALSGEAEDEIVEIPASPTHGLPVGFPAAVRVGNWCFTSMILALDSNGVPVASMAQLDAGARDILPDPVIPVAPSLTSYIAQHAACFSATSAIVEAAGLETGDIVYVGEFYAGLDMAGTILGCASGMATQLSPYCLSSFIQGRLRHPLARACSRVIAYAGSSRETPNIQASALAPVYADAVPAGGLLFTSGEVPIDVEKVRALAEAGDMSAEFNGTDMGRWHGPQPALAQARFIYASLAETLAENGCTVDDVAHQTVYLTHPSDAPQIDLAYQLAFGGPLPPTTFLPIAACSPAKTSRLEIEFVAAIPSPEVNDEN